MSLRYIVDNDLHIHSKLSLCSDDPEQTTERILKYAKDNGLNTICLTDHFWDEKVTEASYFWYEPQNYEHIASSKPLPQSNNVRFLFGCETDISKELVLGVSKERMELFDFIVIPTTHLHHSREFTISDEEGKTARGRANAWVRRFDAVLNMDLPFGKVGIAHLTCGLIAPNREMYLETLNLISDEDMNRLFSKAARLGAGIELNSFDMRYSDDEAEVVLKPYRTAKECGCKFYCGSDAHHPDALDSAKAVFERATEALGLTEDDKFHI